MTQDELKKAVGWAALQYVQPGTIVGVGTGSTAAHFIDALGTMKGQIEGAVSSSDASTEKLKSLGIHVFDLNEVDSLGIYVDGADEINGHMQMIKGGGAALTREKIIASVAEKFICIADASKQVDILGKFPLPVEVIPMARSAVARQLVKLGGRSFHNGFDTVRCANQRNVRATVSKQANSHHARNRIYGVFHRYRVKDFHAVDVEDHVAIIGHHANVHIAAILFFDMLKGGRKSAHNISKDRIG